jgi:hypothetical protein
MDMAKLRVGVWDATRSVWGGCKWSARKILALAQAHPIPAAFTLGALLAGVVALLI